jgi:hypothetical protein
MQPEMTIESNNLKKIKNTIFSIHLPDAQKLNVKVLEKFQIYKDHNDARKSHFFEGRHENIYIPTELIEEVQTVLSFCTHCVTKITGKKFLKSGLWFNYMEPGHITLAHSHDEDDEIYSAVYYVSVPENSGNLIITENNMDIVIQPVDGMIVLFPPNLVHHVTKNNSNKARLSLGINIGNSIT